MQLQSVLRGIHSLADLPQVVAALKHQPAFEAIPLDAWNTPRQPRLDVFAVGESDKLPWFGIATSDPERDSIRLARRICARGRAGMVLALDSANARMAVVAAFDGLPRVEIDLSNPGREVLESLGRLTGSAGAGPLAFAARAAEALSTEPVSRRFFREFRAAVDSLARELRCSLSPDDRHSFSLLQLTRILFLYFIQSKGWLAGRSRFLAEEVDRCVSRGRRVHRDLLRPLFFGTLNTPHQERSRLALGFGAIPFLNGGLFEPHPLERRCRADIPNVLWCSAFDRVFERFHFTISEHAEPGTVAPDMLGRVFEGVMAPAARRASGTFYTPASLVQQILDAGLTVFLASRLRCKETEAQRRLHDPDPAAQRLLRRVTILDPAAGSGAFLLGALELLSRTNGTPGRAAIRKRSVLQRNLFGVDINPAAIRLAELRLWLAVIADETAESPDQVSPLPNLDCLIRQGDSLFEPGGLSTGTGYRPFDAKATGVLSRLRRQLIAAAGSAKRHLEARLRAAEAEMLEKSLEHAKARYQEQIVECLGQARAQDLFGKLRGLDRELAIRLHQLRSGLARVRQAERRFRRDGEVPWFHYPSHFADVFAEGGFDLVLGNPPWLRAETLPADVRSQLCSRYRWWRQGSAGYGNAPDLAIAFLERAVELAAPGGVIAMLLPAKLATASYGTLARHALSSATTLHVAADLTGSPDAPFDATVYPLALVARKAAPGATHRVRTCLRAGPCPTVPQSELRGGDPWILSPRRVRPVISFLAQHHPSLDQTISCHLGVKTGLNRVFLDPPDWIEPELMRWAIRGRDLKPFRFRSKVRLLWTHAADGGASPSLPPRAAQYLAQHERELRARRDYVRGVWWTLFRAAPAQAPHRVVWADLSRQLTAVALSRPSDRECIPLNTCYVAPAQTAVRAEALAAWLNSTWIRAIARSSAVPASGGFARFNAGTVGRVPLAASALDNRELAQLARHARAGDESQTKLDALVAGHLGLSRRDRQILHESLG